MRCIVKSISDIFRSGKAGAARGFEPLFIPPEKWYNTIIDKYARPMPRCRKPNEPPARAGIRNRMKTLSNKPKSRAGLAACCALILALCMLLSGCSAIERIIKRAYEAAATEIPETQAPFSDAPLTSSPLTDAPASEPPETDAPREGPFADVSLARDVLFDYFAIPDIIIGLMTQGDIEMYKRVVTAYFAGETSAEIPEGAGEYPNLWRLIDMYCPVFFADVDDTTVTESEREITWSYNTDRWLTHDEIIDEFESTIMQFVGSIDMDDLLIERVLELYHMYTFTIEYCGDTEGGVKDAPYVYRHAVNAILDNTGVCWCFARAFNFILAQCNVDTATVHGLRSEDRAIHEWVVFFDGEQWRYCDPTWDIGGGTLSYFGFTGSIRARQGYPENDVTVLEGMTHRAADVFGVKDTFFRPLYTCAVCGMDFDLVKEEHRINYFYYSSYDNSRVYTTWFDYVTGDYGDFY